MRKLAQLLFVDVVGLVSVPQCRTVLGAKLVPVHHRSVMTMTIADLAVHLGGRHHSAMMDAYLMVLHAARRSGADLNKVRDVHHDTEVPHLKLHRGLDLRRGGLA